MIKVAICTVSWNGKKDTIELLEGLKKLDIRDLEIKIFVVSNEEIKFPGAEIIIKEENRGSAGGYNDLAKTAILWGADFLLMLNNDTLVASPRLIKSLLETMEINEMVGVVAPKMLFAPGFEFYKDRYKKSQRGKVIWYAGGTFDWKNVMSVHRGIDEVDGGKFDLVEETNFINITCILVRAEVFKKGIFFDEKLFAYFDDNDWSQRLSLNGYKKYYDGLVAIYHKVSQTAGISSPISDYYITRNRLIFGMRYASLRTKIALLRQAASLLFFGRPAQKQGVWDFFLGKVGGKKQFFLEMKD